MAEDSKISWTDNTFNPWIGCTKVSPGCANCYAERDWDKRRHVAQWGPVGTRIVTSEENWKKPLRWNKQAAEAGTRIKVFCASLADVFEDWNESLRESKGRPLGICPKCHKWEPMRAHSTCCNEQQDDLCIGDVRRQLFSLIDQTPHLDWLLVTKRPEHVLNMWPHKSGPWIKDGKTHRESWHRSNVWLLTSVENQEQADNRIPELLKCRDLAPVLGLSCEPLLGPVNLRNIPARRYDLIGNFWEYNCENDCGWRGLERDLIPTEAGDNDSEPHWVCPKCLCSSGLVEKQDDQPGIDWVIAGGESGPGARPMHPDWARSLRDQCQDAGVPFHFKQWGEFCDEETWERLPAIGSPEATLPWADDRDLCPVYRVGKEKAGRLLDGREWNEFPTVTQQVQP